MAPFSEVVRSSLTKFGNDPSCKGLRIEAHSTQPQSSVGNALIMCAVIMIGAGLFLGIVGKIFN